MTAALTTTPTGTAETADLARPAGPTDPASCSAELRAALADRITATIPGSGRWAREIRDLRREWFLPGHRNPRLGRVLAHQDLALPLQIDAGGTPCAAALSPMLLARMLTALDPHPGHRVLEIGTGTGYGTALLCSVLGDRDVVSVELHPDLHHHAQAALHRAGHHPTLVCVDARDPRHNALPTAAFDWIIDTCDLTRVPPAWLGLLTPGGRIVAPIARHLAVLDHQPTTGALSGPFLNTGGPVEVTDLRDDLGDIALTPADITTLTSASVDAPHSERAATWWDEATTSPIAFLRRLHLPDVHQHLTHTGHGDTRLHLAEPSTGSWAHLNRTPEGTVLRDGGPRPLHRLLVDLITRWNHHNRPDPHRHGLTITPGGHHTLWLDDPTGPTARLDTPPHRCRWGQTGTSSSSPIGSPPICDDNSGDTEQHHPDHP